MMIHFIWICRRRYRWMCRRPPESSGIGASTASLPTASRPRCYSPMPTCSKRSRRRNLNPSKTKTSIPTKATANRLQIWSPEIMIMSRPPVITITTTWRPGRRRRREWCGSRPRGARLLLRSTLSALLTTIPSIIILPVRGLKTWRRYTKICSNLKSSGKLRKSAKSRTRSWANRSRCSSRIKGSCSRRSRQMCPWSFPISNHSMMIISRTTIGQITWGKRMRVLEEISIKIICRNLRSQYRRRRRGRSFLSLRSGRSDRRRWTRERTRKRSSK